MLKDLTILFVEDDNNTRMFMNFLLRDLVKKVYIAENGIEGLDKYKQYNPDIVLTDITMPEMDGLEMSKEIKKIDPYQAIVILSAYDEKNNLLNTLDIGIDNFITKPTDVDILTEKLEKIANKIEQQKKLCTLANIDNITKLPNKYSFEQKIQEVKNKLLRKGVSFCVFCIDLNNFTKVNNICSIQKGNEILYTVSNKIKDIIRIEDFLARIGSDEFGLIVEDIDEYGIKTLTQKILNITDVEIKCSDEKFEISSNIGIVHFNNPSADLEEILSKAYIALNKAKQSQKGFYILED